MCCAKVVQSVKATPTSTTVTNTTSYQCLPLEYVAQVGTYILSTTTNYSYSCVTTKAEPTYCTSASDTACSSDTQCCAARGAAVSTGSVIAFNSNVCYTKTNTYSWTINQLSTSAPNITYARNCLQAVSSSTNGIQLIYSAIFGIISIASFYVL
ncbi:UNKNOWN [Stylonychia lemnae]|uniref:Uncharacterized protein n=1 Tax=Stylonychia lemnae TaxID=5949 RepID=A0A078AX62_STYLE|nr:UNKNOWN [Stylonychia lemnae]|eukprot:CDW86656.1 UNKNOWN [Stylonychia lemnae]